MIKYVQWCDREAWKALANEVSQVFGCPNMDEDAEFIKYMDSKIEKRLAIKAEDEDRNIMGIVGVSVSKNKLTWVGVFPKYRNRGVGEMLVKSGISMLDRTKDITLETFREDFELGLPARVLYKKVGFIQVRNDIFDHLGNERCQMVLRRGVMNTDRLVVRRFTEADLDIIYEINNHPECIRFNGWDEMNTEKCLENIRGWMKGYKDNMDTGAFCVEEEHTGEKIGMAFIVPWKEEGEYEVGFRLKREKWGHGYAKELTKGFIELAQKKLGGTSIIAEVWRDNERSRNIFNKLGFYEEKHPEGENGVLYSLKIN